MYTWVDKKATPLKLLRLCSFIAQYHYFLPFFILNIKWTHYWELANQINILFNKPFRTIDIRKNVLLFLTAQYDHNSQPQKNISSISELQKNRPCSWYNRFLIVLHLDFSILWYSHTTHFRTPGFFERCESLFCIVHILPNSWYYLLLNSF